MIIIKDFIQQRDKCIICDEELELDARCYAIRNISLELNENILNFKCNYFDFAINIQTNDFITKSEYCTVMHLEINLSLFCPTHTDLSVEGYNRSLIFDLYKGQVLNEYIVESLILQNFSLISTPPHLVRFINNRTKKEISFPYFDYSHMSLSRLEDKIKTYLLVQ